jgi:hypothetical protein
MRGRRRVAREDAHQTHSVVPPSSPPRFLIPSLLGEWTGEWGKQKSGRVRGEKVGRWRRRGKKDGGGE